MKKNLLTFSIICAVFCLSGCGSGETMLPRDAHRSALMAHEQEISGIIAQMTQEEKVEMLHAKFMFVSAGVERLGIADISYADGPFGIREEMEPKSWNSIHLATDSATFFPTGSALAATWDEDIAYLYGTGMAAEAKRRGKDMILGPAINIQRIPTGGRTYEYLSEDPFLSSRLSVGYTKGVQDNGVAVCLKHYALNNQETNRGTVNAIVSDRAIREIYLPPFEAAVVEADAYGVMSAYNKVNGTWCSESDFLLNQVLRRDWGFRGIVISDWGGTHSVVKSTVAGLNVEMPSADYHGKALLDSLKSGAIAESVIDERVRELLRVRMAVEPVPAAEANKVMAGQPEQAAIARKVAEKSIVLLKNEGALLPVRLQDVKEIAVIGDNADRIMATGGVGAGVKALYEITPLAGIRQRVGDAAVVTFARGYAMQQNRRGFGMMQQQSGQDDAAQRLLDEAVKAAEKADVVFFIGGNNRQWETEGSDRQNMKLPYNQEKVLEAVAAANPRVVFVNVAGAPSDLDVVEACAPAILQSWFNGTEGGTALASVLFGDISPSGHLPFSYPVHLEDSPAYALGNFPQTDAPVSEDVFVSLVGANSVQDAINGSSNRTTAAYSEDLLVGYRWFDTRSLPVRYPFGHGLSYSTFSYENLQTSADVYKDGEDIEVTFTLTNTGNMTADAVPQLYVHRTDAKVAWPYKELKAFRRLTLAAGESREVTLTVPVEQLKYWNQEAYGWTLEPGGIELQLGTSAGDILLRRTVSVK